MSTLHLPVARARRATVAMPGDKSLTHRALMIAAIAFGKTRIVGANTGADVRSTAQGLRQVGVTVRRTGDIYLVTGASQFRNPKRTIDCGNSGTTMRMLAGLLSGKVHATLDGDDSLRRRPMERVAEPLRLLGTNIRTTRGRPPIHLRAAHLSGARVKLRVPSAQVKTAVMLAALGARGPTSLESLGATRDHTERMLLTFGARLRLRGRTITVYPSRLVSPGRVQIAGDFSSAVFFACAAALLPGAMLTLRGVGINPTRTAALDVLRDMGVRAAVQRTRTLLGELVGDLKVSGGAPLRATTIGPHAVPNLIDEIPALCALAAAAKVCLRIRGAQELHHKESDRIRTIVELLHRFGVHADALTDGIVVNGGAQLRAPNSVTTRGDHRIGMSAAILAAAAGKPIDIEDAACIGTSFPGFKQSWARAFGT